MIHSYLKGSSLSDGLELRVCDEDALVSHL
jgi:hypothetical protein